MWGGERVRGGVNEKLSENPLGGHQRIKRRGKREQERGGRVRGGRGGRRERGRQRERDREREISERESGEELLIQ